MYPIDSAFVSKYSPSGGTPALGFFGSAAARVGAVYLLVCGVIAAGDLLFCAVFGLVFFGTWVSGARPGVDSAASAELFF